MKPTATLRTLLAEAIDYAGLFPPARLPMHDAVQRYASYLEGSDVWTLGRFVLPAARLNEFVADHRAPGAEGRPWRLSAILGPDPVADCEAVRRFNDAHSASACIDSVEMKVNGSGTSAIEQVTAVSESVPRSVRLFAELPIGGDTTTVVEALRASHASAKIRTGGVTPDAFPEAREVAWFLCSCAENDLSFKATAGLHHACRGTYPLTYENHAPTGLMFGFLNVLLAAVFARAGLNEDRIVSVLETEDPGQFWFGTDEIRWRDVRVSQVQVRESRRRFVLSFGSCSFEEPMQELRALSLL